MFQSLAPCALLHLGLLILMYVSSDQIRLLGPLDEPPIAVIVRELLKGLEYLHGEGYVHRDIKVRWINSSSHGFTLP